MNNILSYFSTNLNSFLSDVMVSGVCACLLNHSRCVFSLNVDSRKSSGDPSEQ